MGPDDNELQSIIPSASPIAAMGLDPDEVLASGNPQAYIAAKRAGIPYINPNARPVAAAPTQISALASSVQNPPPAASGTSAAQPQPSVSRDATAYSIPQSQVSGLSGFGQRLAQSQVPATNAPDPTSEPVGGPAVPSNITPTGRSSFSDIARTSLQRANDVTDQASTLSDSANRVNPSTIEAQRVAASAPQSADNPNGTPNFRDPNHPEYRPSAGRRIVRGLVGGLEGLAEGGIFGAARGALNPESVGGTAYGAPSPKFSAAAQQAAARVASLDQQLSQADTQAKTGDEATKTKLEIAKQFSANAKDAAAGSTAETKSASNRKALAAAGLKLSDPDDPNSSIVNDPDSEVFKGREALNNLRSSQQDLADAKAELARQQGDPNSPAYRLAVDKNRTAQVNASAAQERAQAYMGNYLQHSKNIDLQGNVLPGAPVISNDEGAKTVVGSTNANTAIKNQSNAAQFNDVHGALDDLEGKAKALVQKGGSLNSPAIAAALAQPKGTLGKWLQGEGVKAGLSPEERAYVQSIASAHENIQALRKSAGGTATDSAVEKLDSMIPNASTPDINYLLGQTGQIRNTAERLGKGATEASGGLHVRRGGKSAGSTPTPSGMAVSLSDARGMPQNKGKSDADITADIKAHGHEVRP